MDGRITERLEEGWRFHRGDAAGAWRESTDDSGWRRVTVPHDWSIEGPLNPRDAGGKSGGYLPGGRAWYRKSFKLPAGRRGGRVFLEFDGVYMNGTVWVNGHRLGTHHYGYTGFCFEITKWSRFGRKRNLVAVRVDNSKRPNTRWYSGAGIYRHVRLVVKNAVHIRRYGVSAVTVRAGRDRARLEITSLVRNDSESSAEVFLRTAVIEPDGRKAAGSRDSKRIPAGRTGKFVQRVTVKRPRLWSPDAPSLYRIDTAAGNLEGTMDTCSANFGIRTYRLDAEKGLVLNGKPIKLRGVNMHHDNGCLGSAAWDRAEERRVELVKSIRANAIRTSHNPPSPAFLDACDRLGIVVVDEAFDEWKVGKLKYGYKDYFGKCWRDDLREMVMRDRNHPSVFIWSIGNEVPEQDKASGAKTAAMMARYVRKLDPTRPVGYGAHPKGWTDDLWKALDVCGYNYRDDLYGKDHRKYPGRRIFGSETFALYAFKTWNCAVENRHVIGEFIWTGMDYIGESGIGFAREEHTGYPTHTACCGELDTCGFKKTRSWYRDILWGKDPVLHIAVRRRLKEGEPFRLNPWGWPEAKSSWTWPDAIREWPADAPEDMHVDVYSTCDEVELTLNGKKIGRNSTSKLSRYMASWIIPYEPGILEAVGYTAGRAVMTDRLVTAGKPEALRLKPDRGRIRADGRDLSYVTVEVTDGKGLRQPNADNGIRFSVKGPGVIAGVDNGHPASEEAYQGRKRSAYNGRCLVVIRAGKKPGTIVLTARSPGLKQGRAVIRTRVKG
ncbi:MAG: glycoside hydrolase family 2 TIM barrel-domain containing protein [Kiritimatiellia bacterium]